MRLLTAAITQVCHFVSEPMEGKRVLEVKNYIQRGIYPKRIRKSETKKRNFRRDCKKFKVRDGVLFFSSKGKDLRVVAEKEKIDILKSIHAQPHGGHLGINKTLVYRTRRIF